VFYGVQSSVGAKLDGHAVLAFATYAGAVLLVGALFIMA
jgi:hypothetical protein